MRRAPGLLLVAPDRPTRRSAGTRAGAQARAGRCSRIRCALGGAASSFLRPSFPSVPRIVDANASIPRSTPHPWPALARSPGATSGGDAAITHRQARATRGGFWLAAAPTDVLEACASSPLRRRLHELRHCPRADGCRVRASVEAVARARATGSAVASSATVWCVRPFACDSHSSRCVVALLYPGLRERRARSQHETPNTAPHTPPCPSISPLCRATAALVLLSHDTRPDPRRRPNQGPTPRRTSPGGADQPPRTREPIAAQAGRSRTERRARQLYHHQRAQRLAIAALLQGRRRCVGRTEGSSGQASANIRSGRLPLLCSWAGFPKCVDNCCNSVACRDI